MIHGVLLPTTSFGAAAAWVGLRALMYPGILVKLAQVKNSMAKALEALPKMDSPLKTLVLSLNHVF